MVGGGGGRGGMVAGGGGGEHSPPRHACIDQSPSLVLANPIMVYPLDIHVAAHNYRPNYILHALVVESWNGKREAAASTFLLHTFDIQISPFTKHTRLSFILRTLRLRSLYTVLC